VKSCAKYLKYINLLGTLGMEKKIKGGSPDV
jgi:hypothetical protein